MTLVEKILARHLVRTPHTGCELVPGDGAFVRPHWRFIVDVYTGMARHLLHATLGPSFRVRDAASIVAFADHFSSPTRVRRTSRAICCRASACARGARAVHVRARPALARLSARRRRIGRHCHPIMAERYALPGQVVVGTDSHTPHSGALGCLAFGVGTTDMANAMVTGPAATIPQTLCVRLKAPSRRREPRTSSASALASED